MNRQTTQMKQAITASMLLFLLVCACSDAAPEDQNVPQGAAGPEQASATDPNTSEACRFFTEEEAEAALGYPVKLTSASTFGYGKCEFEPVGGERYGSGELILMVLEPMDPANNFAETREMAGDVEDVPDVGDQAFLYSTELWVLAGAHHVMVRVEWYGDQGLKVRETDIKIAEIVLSRL